MRGIPGPMPRTPEWHAYRRLDPDRTERKFVIGATLAAACCGMSPYTQPLDVFCQLRGLHDGPEDNDAMRMGRRLEPVILDEYQDRRLAALTRGLPMYFSEDHWFMGATPDAIGEELGGPEFGVDAKATTYRRHDRTGLDPLKFGEEGTDQMPVDYVMQGQAQCAVLGLPYVEFPVLFDARVLRIYKVERNDDLIASIVKAEREMAERVLNDDPPEPNWRAEDTRSLISMLHGYDGSKVIDLGSEAIAAWADIQRRKEQIDDLEATNEEAKARILWSLGDAAAGRFPQGTKELRRVRVAPTLVTERDVQELRDKLGQVKRKGFESLREVKVK
jgi:predicted phage-related endonuclease